MIELMLRELPSISTIASIAILALTAYFITQCIYDLFFHQLRKFPSPKLAAIGSFYEFYYDVIRDSTYLWEIEKMHRTYGMEDRLSCPL